MICCRIVLPGYEPDPDAVIASLPDGCTRIFIALAFKLSVLHPAVTPVVAVLLVVFLYLGPWGPELSERWAGETLQSGLAVDDRAVIVAGL